MFLATECFYFRLNMWSHLFYVLYVTGSASFVTWHICSTFTPVCHQFYKKYAWTWRKTLCICRSSSDHSLGSIVMVAKVFFFSAKVWLRTLRGTGNYLLLCTQYLQWDCSTHTILTACKTTHVTISTFSGSWDAGEWLNTSSLTTEFEQYIQIRSLLHCFPVCYKTISCS